MTNAVTQALKDLREAHPHSLNAIDIHFADCVGRYESGDSRYLVTFLAASAHAIMASGGSCVYLDNLLRRPFGIDADQTGELTRLIPDSEEWDSLIESAQCISDSGQTPLIITEGRVYLNQMWRFEDTIARSLVEMAEQPNDINYDVLPQFINELFTPRLDILFSKLSSGADPVEATKSSLHIDHPCKTFSADVMETLESASCVEDLKPLLTQIPKSFITDWQEIAVAASLKSRLSVITGGPGTGKTTTVVKLLASIIKNDTSLDKEAPVIRLVAPTGKAAMRLSESIGGALQTLELDSEIKESIPTSASTIHRMLGAMHGQSEFRFNSNYRLHLDVLVVDEASMIDLPLMHAIITALPPHARLILLGDKDQLASVDVGDIFGDICSFLHKELPTSQSKNIKKLTESYIPANNSLSSMNGAISKLHKSFRFDGNSGIGHLARIINDGDVDALDYESLSRFSDVDIFELDEATHQQAINNAAKGYSDYLTSIAMQEDREVIINHFEKLRVLGAVHEGPVGIKKLNKQIESKLESQGLIKRDAHTIWYEGRPIIVTANDFGTGLYNGDIGITVKDEETGQMVVIFPFPDGSIKQFQTCRIPSHETAFAMTIHKSQGSEFDKVIMLLPPSRIPVVTRELIYTGETRAKKQIELYAQHQILTDGIRITTRRNSGLAAHIKKHIQAQLRATEPVNI